jgi:hypothetical protein
MGCAQSQPSPEAAAAATRRAERHAQAHLASVGASANNTGISPLPKKSLGGARSTSPGASPAQPSLLDDLQSLGCSTKSQTVEPTVDDLGDGAAGILVGDSVGIAIENHRGSVVDASTLRAARQSVSNDVSNNSLTLNGSGQGFLDVSGILPHDGARNTFSVEHCRAASVTPTGERRASHLSDCSHESRRASHLSDHSHGSRRASSADESRRSSGASLGGSRRPSNIMDSRRSSHLSVDDGSRAGSVDSAIAHMTLPCSPFGAPDTAPLPAHASVSPSNSRRVSCLSSRRASNASSGRSHSVSFGGSDDSRSRNGSMLPGDADGLATVTNPLLPGPGRPMARSRPVTAERVRASPAEQPLSRPATPETRHASSGDKPVANDAASKARQAEVLDMYRRRHSKAPSTGH